MRFRTTTMFMITTTAVMLLSVFASAQTCPGSPACLDPTFGVDGTTITYGMFFPGKAPSAAKALLQSDGKVLALGNASSSDSNTVITNYITRYNTDGSIDQTFGNAGFVYLNFRGSGTAGGYAMAIGIQHFAADDRIVVAGNTTYQQNPNALRVERHLMDGSLDTSFGTNGVFVKNTGYAQALAVQPNDQKIVMMGDMGDLVRLKAGGTLDTTFGSNGIRATGVTAMALALQSDGKIIAAGSTISSNATVFAVARFTTNGTADNTFGKKGLATATFFSYFSRAFDVKVDSNNRVIAVGSSRPSSPITGSDLVIARFTASGLLDTTFNGSGKVTQDFFGTWDVFCNVDIQSNGKILASGSTPNSVGNRDYLVARYNYDGSLDTGFGTGGIVTTDILMGSDYSNDGVIWTDPTCSCEKFVLLGIAYPSGVNNVTYGVAARYIL